MMAFIITIHVIACFVLIGLVLIQRGRGGGLVESFSGVESMFGTKTSAFLTRTTTILSIVFFITCLSLAILSIRQSKSLMSNVKTEQAPAQEASPMSEAEATAVQESQVTEETSEAGKEAQETQAAVTETAVTEQQAFSEPPSEQKVEPQAK